MSVVSKSALALGLGLALALVSAAPALAQEEEKRKAAGLGFDFDRSKMPIPTVGVVTPDSTATDLGLKTGDVIVGAFGQEVANIQDLVRILRGRGQLMGGDPFELTVRRGEQVLELKGELRSATPDVEGERAKPWSIARWGNQPEGAPAPTLENLKGKVIVLFTFSHT